MERVDLTTGSLVIDDKPVAIDKYVNDWVSVERDRRVNSFPSQAEQEGVHDLSFEAERSFEGCAAVLNGRELARMRLRGQVRVRVLRPKIISHFEVATRGRVLTVALDLAGVQLNAAFVALPSAPKSA